ncbi:MAG: Hsp20/alpha crystallin family protein [Candidatus Kerfeldbacteria bacterium]|nr:Hsp20/alpha crystallin family protein [Candidatus Kerfeldbacteria bacterium]
MPQNNEKPTAQKKASTTEENAKFFSAVVASQEKTERKQGSGSANVDATGEQKEDQWLTDNFEGQLAVDVYQTDENVVIQSTLAGVRVEDIDIAVNNDMVTIRGVRRREHEVKSENYFYQECYWGGFSRSIILPFDVKSEKVTAALKNGILTVVLPKADKPSVRNVRVKEEIEDQADV